MYILDDSEVHKTIYSPVCTFCVHLINGLDRECEAFKKIPDDIWEGEKRHTEPYPGDKGIRFKKREK